MASLNILLGGEFFRTLREENHCYVDKTGLLEELLDANRPQVSLITRPRRFGKTLTMTMLQEFFDITKDSRELFAGLSIAKNEHLCSAWMNKYPTVFLTLKGVEGENYAHALERLSKIIRRVCAESDYLLSSEKVRRKERETLESIITGKPDIYSLEDSLLSLCCALEAHCGQSAILLIDEYDVPINHAAQQGYYQEMIGFLRNMLGAALKSNPSLKITVLTGCLRIARESIFTGLNNF